MKYRILEKNGNFIVELKNFLFWHSVKQNRHPECYSTPPDILFSSTKNAEQYIENKIYGIIRNKKPWQVVKEGEF